MKTLLQVGIVPLVVGCCLIAGCGGANYTVSGKVLLDGQPLEGAGVRLVSKDPSKTAVHSGTTDANGKFEIVENESNPIEPGEYVVVVDKVPSEMGGTSVVPVVYQKQATSPLTAKIEGSSTVLPDLQMQSKKPS